MYANYVKYYAQKNYAIMYIMQCNYVDADLFSPLILQHRKEIITAILI